ncbi:hypothetical protein GCM10007895_03930 [Paraferrimonas sedimenticola]|uniref:Uncharacterized protein n=1 Tax=Paraferrimonas sedimenticola TaxID=375674 RepID=A0AA37RUH4_9GAMM|nr:hypothetical protein GCM10007895_03930 [Paraferrimonas sedimenticola]
MRQLHRIALLTALIFTATYCYLVGSMTKAISVLLIGAGIELLFWIKLFSADRKE